MENNDYREFSLEEIEKRAKELGFGFPSITHDEWVEEDGQRCSMWTIDSWSGTKLSTGDGGIELFRKVFQEQMEQALKDMNNEKE